MIKVKVKLLSDTAKLPVYSTEKAACMDLFSNASTVIQPKSSVKIPTGIAVELPHDYELQVRPRSGLSLTSPLLIMFGTVDEDYRGEVGIIIKNYGNEPFTVNIGDRIAQVKLEKVERIEWEVVNELSETNRGLGGFGHTGVK